MSANNFSIEELQSKRLENLQKVEEENNLLVQSQESFINKIKDMDNKLFALFLVKYHKVEKSIIENGYYKFPKFHLGICHFSNTSQFDEELVEVCRLKYEFKKLGSFKNDLFTSNDYDSNTPGIDFSDKFIKEKLIDGFEQLGFIVDKELYFNFVPNESRDEYYRPFKISIKESI